MRSERNTMSKTDMDDWERIGDRTKQMKRDILDIEGLLTEVPEEAYRDELDAIDTALSELRDSLESQMFDERSELDDRALSIFYGSLDPSYRTSMHGSSSRSKWKTEADD